MDIERKNYFTECETEIAKDVRTKIQAIVDRKVRGIDCTEQESAEIKQHIKRDDILIDGIKDLFPIEHGEVLLELEK
jgi:hypothetical protein